MKEHKKKPVFLNLVKIKLPITGWVSIAHRISGLLLFSAIPGLVYLLGLSLASEAGYEEVASLVHSFPLRVLISLLIWALFYHLLAGVSFLLIDLDVGVGRQSARKSSALVMLGGILLAILTGVLLWSG